MNRWDRLAFHLSNTQIFRAINRGLVSMLPVILIGSIVLAVLNLPIAPFQAFMRDVFGESWRELGLILHNATLNILGLAALFTVSYFLAYEQPAIMRGETSAIIVVLNTFCCYLAIMQQDLEVNFPYSGASGLFYSLLIAAVSVKLLFLFDRLYSRLYNRRHAAFLASPELQSAFRMIIPCACTLLVFAAGRMMLNQGVWDDMLGSLPRHILDNYLVNDSLFSVIVIVFLTQILWFFGIHGGNVVMDSVPLMEGVAANGGFILTKEFYDVFVYLGGAGATLGLLIALFIENRNAKNNRVAKASLFPAIFNINETLVYGTPLIFNPYYFVPFLLAPLLLGVISYAAIVGGLVPQISGQALWTAPVFLSGYQVTGSLAGAILQGINLAISTIVYLPFVRVSNRAERKARLQTFEELQREVPDMVLGDESGMITRMDKVGALARGLAQELWEAFETGRVPLHLEYQPKTDKDGKLLGAEALLRWIHPEYGYVSPIVTIAVADDSGLASRLGTWVYNTALDEYARWRELGLDGLRISINLDPLQLRDDKEFLDVIRGGLLRTGVPPSQVELELTEHIAIFSSEATQERLEKIREMGISLSIDDLGMGHSSLMYLSDFHVDTIKIDGSVIRTVETDKSRQAIVRSVLDLSRHLDLDVVVEGVETVGQLDKLVELGCQHFQGFYFSRAMPGDQFVSFTRKHGIIS